MGVRLQVCINTSVVIWQIYGEHFRGFCNGQVLADRLGIIKSTLEGIQQHKRCQSMNARSVCDGHYIGLTYAGNNACNGMEVQRFRRLYDLSSSKMPFLCHLQRSMCWEQPLCSERITLAIRNAKPQILRLPVLNLRRVPSRMDTKCHIHNASSHRWLYKIPRRCLSSIMRKALLWEDLMKSVLQYCCCCLQGLEKRYSTAP